MTATRNRCAALAATVVAVLAGVGLAPPATAASPGRCAPGEGVTVVVDFGALGGGVPIACVADGGGEPVSTVMARAGFDLDEVRTQPGFVCAIDGKPAPDSHCARTPPADAYWGLFWANGSSSGWSYSTTGAHSLQVPDGGSVGWRWQDSNSRTTPGAPPTTGTPPKPEPTKPPRPTKPAKPTEPTKPAPEPSEAPAAPSSPAGSPSASSPGTPSGSPRAGASAGQAGGPATERAERQAARVERRAERRAEVEAGRGADEATGHADGQVDEQVTAEAATAEETPLTPTSAADDGSGALTWVAGGAVLVLAVAAGVLARRRRG
jgi:hypothetical protein